MTTLSTSKIKSITKINLNSKRYDISVANNNNFFANGILVHNCQNLTDYLPGWQGRYFHVSEKANGTSFTAYSYGDLFGVCSRNIDLKPTDNNTHWNIARKYNLEEKIKGRNLAIQGEIIGPGIQGNYYGLPTHELYVFNIFDITAQQYLPKLYVQDLCEDWNLNYVPIYDDTFLLNHNVDQLLSLAEGKSALADVEREGLVFVSDFPTRVSFKCISNKFLLGENG